MSWWWPFSRAEDPAEAARLVAEARAVLDAPPPGDEAPAGEEEDEEEGPPEYAARAAALLDRALRAAPSCVEAILLRVEVAIDDEGDPDLGLALLARHRRALAGLPPAQAALALELEANAFADQGELERALAIHEKLLATQPDDPGHIAGRGRCLFELARFDEARPDLERAVELLPDDASARWWLACLRERQRRMPDADRLFREAEELDPHLFPAPVRLPRKEYDRAVRDALDSLPDEVRHALDDVVVKTEDLPPDDVVREHSHDTMGLFSGPSVAAEVEHRADPAGQQPTITLYRRNIEKNARDAEGVAEQVRITVLHEFGHRLGFDEEGVDRLGLG